MLRVQAGFEDIDNMIDDMKRGFNDLWLTLLKNSLNVTTGTSL